MQETDVLMHKQKSFGAIPPGNYSGIVGIGGDEYALISDKGRSTGYRVLGISFTSDGDIASVEDKGYRDFGGRNEDIEAVAFYPHNHHLYIGNEETSSIMELGNDSILSTVVINDFARNAYANRSIESLCYDAYSNSFFTVNESPLRGDSALTLRLKRLDNHLKETATYDYKLAQPEEQTPEKGGTHVLGCAELASMNDGTLLSLEREFYLPKRKIGAWVKNKIFRFIPGQKNKQLVASWSTRLTLFNHSFANYEGMCLGPKTRDGRQIVLLCADSQNRYKGILKDWFRTIVLR